MHVTFRPPLHQCGGAASTSQMALLHESLLARSSRSLLSGRGVTHLTSSALRWPATLPVQSSRHARCLRLEARHGSGAVVEAPKPLSTLSRHIGTSSVPAERKQDGAECGPSNGDGPSALWPLRYVMERLFHNQRQQQEQSGKHQQPSQVDFAPHPSSPRRSSLDGRSSAAAAGAAPTTGNLERQYSSSSDATAASSDGSNGSGAPAGSRKQRSVDELTEAENWHLQRAYAELARLQHLQASKQTQHGVSRGSANGSSTPGSNGVRVLRRLEPTAEEEQALAEARAAVAAAQDTNLESQQIPGQSGASQAYDVLTGLSQPASGASDSPQERSRIAKLQSGARRIGGWVRMPALPALTATLPDLPSIGLDHPAVQLAWRRAHAGSRPGQRTDSAKLGLVVEGGGMRGVVSAGSLMTLYELGLKDSFDAVYGASAGAINATYFLTGQREGVDIYSEDIANKMFLDLTRFVGLGDGPVMDLGFLIDHVMNTIKPLRWRDVITSNVPLKVVASCLDSLQPVILEKFVHHDDLATCLKASANIPVIAGKPIKHRGRRLVDGAVFEGIPFRQAIADGCTHLVVLCTRPPFRGSKLRKALSDLGELTVKRGLLNPKYMHAAWRAELEQITREQMTGDEMLVLSLEPRSAQELPVFHGAYVAPLYPAQTCNISPVCLEPTILRGGVAEGRRIVAATFDPQGLGMPDAVPPLLPCPPSFASPLALHARTHACTLIDDLCLRLAHAADKWTCVKDLVENLY
mmetsp:Transcript_2190/g.6529  ORF Transcript_2190/g.6529 Transcript_2190/m.6529 type:complete len:751 (-) Transcript_2190:502-2754(-)